VLTSYIRDINRKSNFDRAHAGQEIILAKAGKPYARLMPLAPKQTQRQPGRLAGRVGDEFFEPLPEDELHVWEE